LQYIFIWYNLYGSGPSNPILYCELIRKGGAFDKDNGLKRDFLEGTDILLETYTLKDGVRHGPAQEYLLGTLVEECEYQNGVKQGPYRRFLFSVLKEKGTYRDGEKHGLVETFDGPGNRTGYYNYAMGKLQGKAIERFEEEPNGVRAYLEINYEAGILNGPTFLHISDGVDSVRIENGSYSMDQRNGRNIIPTNDTLLHTNFLNDKLEGIAYAYDFFDWFHAYTSSDSSRLVPYLERTFVNGAKTGPFRDFENGILEREGNNLNDQLQGLIKEYCWMQECGARRGDLVSISQYTNGQLNGPRELMISIEDLGNGRYIVDDGYYEKSNYRNGVLNGPYYWGTSDGQMIRKGSYSNGLQEGTWEEQGDPYYITAQMRAGKLDGLYTVGVGPGDVFEKLRYKADELHGLCENLNSGITAEYADGALKWARRDLGGGNFDKYEIVRTVGSHFWANLELVSPDSRTVAQYKILKGTEELPSFRDFFDTFVPQQVQATGTLDGPYLWEHNGKTIEQGQHANGQKTGKWIYNFYDQDVRVTIVHQLNPEIEQYSRISTSEPFEGDFIYTYADGSYEERKIKDGLRDGRSILYSKDQEKIRVTKYEEGIIDE